MKRLSEGSITDLAMRLAEKAETIDKCIILYELKEKDEDGAVIRAMCDDRLTVADANWMMDVIKHELITNLEGEDD